MHLDQHLNATIKRNDNGERGEARSRALLLDKFWVLTRSIDTDGADFLIQLRTAAEITHWGSLQRPAIGRVQAKWIQDEDTDIYLDPAHVEENPGRPWPEYWLLVHTGSASMAEVAWLSAADIVKHFSKTLLAKKNEKYRLPGKVLLRNFTVPVDQFDERLARMEETLDRLSYRDNSKFLRETGIMPAPPLADYLNSKMPSSYHIDKEEIERWRQKVETEFWDIDWRAETLREILSAGDLSDALQSAASYRNMRDGKRDLYDRDLEIHITEVKLEHEWLRAKGKLQTYENLRSQLEKYLMEQTKTEPLAFSMSFDPDYWTKPTIMPIPAQSVHTPDGERVSIGSNGSFLIRERESITVHYSSTSEAEQQERSDQILRQVLQALVKEAMAEDPVGPGEITVTFDRPDEE